MNEKTGNSEPSYYMAFREGIATISFSGPLLSPLSELLLETCRAEISATPGIESVVFDFAQTTTMDQDMYAKLLKLIKAARRCATRLQFCGLQSDAVDGLLRIEAISTHEIKADLRHALDSLL